MLPKNASRYLASLAIAVMFPLAAGRSPQAAASDLSKFLHEMLSEQQNRQLSPGELNYYANYYRQQGMFGSLVQLYASDGYFSGQCQGNYNVYVTQIFRNFVGRDPRPDEARYWTNQFAVRGSGARAAIIQEICRANQVTQQSLTPVTLPALPVPTSLPDLANELANHANSFAIQTTIELGNTVYGRRIAADARTLLAVTQQFQQIAGAGYGSGQQLAIQLDNVQRQYDEVSAELRNIPGASYQLTSQLQQIAQLIAAARQYTGVAVSQPVYPGQLPGWNSSALRAFDAVSRNWAQSIVSLSSYNPYYASLARDAQGLVVQTEALDALMRQSASRGDIELATYQINQMAARIRQTIGQADAQTQRGWWHVQQTLDKMNASLGIHSDLNYAPGQAVIVNRPIWGGSPLQNSGYGAPTNANATLVNATDALITQIDQYGATLQSIAVENPTVNGLLSSMGDLRNAALRFRQVAATGGYGTQLSYSAGELLERYQVTANFFASVVAQNPSFNSPVFMQIGEAISQIRRNAF